MGICHLCGKYTKLTKEHVPPKSAFNKGKVLNVTGNELINAMQNKNFKGKFTQNGTSVYSLCQSCNNNAGAWYVNDYTDFCKSIVYYLIKQKAVDNKLIIKNDSIQFGYIMKQIMCMNVSFLKYETVKLFGIDKYLLEKDKFEIDTTKFKLYCYINSDYKVFNATGMIIKKELNNSYCFASLKTFPLGFILNFNPESVMDKWKQMLDITDLLKLDNNPVKITLGLPIINNYEPIPMLEEIIKKSKPNT